MSKWIVITSPSEVENEMQAVVQLFEVGLDVLHLRKPQSTATYCAQWIERLPPSLRQRVMVHDHFSLASIYQLKGIHLNCRNPLPPSMWKGTISRSCHSLDEVKRYKEQCDYVFLSPIFDSISKVNYQVAFSFEQLDEAAQNEIIDPKVMALGGISIDNLSLVRRWNFGGVVFMGEIWNNFQKLSSHDFSKYLIRIEHLVHG